MAALTTFRNTAQQEPSPASVANFGFGIAASVTCHQGGMVELSATGLAQPAGTAGTQQPVVGICTDPEGGDISTGANSLTVNVVQGVFELDQGAGADAMTVADVGSLVYCIDDHTVGRTNSNGTRPVAGKLVFVDSGGNAWVEIGFIQGFKDCLDLHMIATAAIPSGAGLAVQADASNPGQVVLVSAAGGPALGILQNSPTAGGLAIVRVAGASLVQTAAAQTVGDLLGASTTTGKSKVAVVLTTAGSTVTAGSAVFGIALTSTGSAGTIQALVTPGGGIKQSVYS